MTEEVKWRKGIDYPDYLTNNKGKPWNPERPDDRVGRPEDEADIAEENLQRWLDQYVNRKKGK